LAPKNKKTSGKDLHNLSFTEEASKFSIFQNLAIILRLNSVTLNPNPRNKYPTKPQVIHIRSDCKPKNSVFEIFHTAGLFEEEKPL